MKPDEAQLVEHAAQLCTVDPGSGLDFDRWFRVIKAARSGLELVGSSSLERLAVRGF